MSGKGGFLLKRKLAQEGQTKKRNEVINLVQRSIFLIYEGKLGEIVILY